MKNLRLSDILEFSFCSLTAYVGISIINNLGNILSSKKHFTFSTVIQSCVHNGSFLLSVLFSVFLGGLFVILIGQHHSLDIKLNRAGNGQYGMARFMTDEEKEKSFPFVRSGHEHKPGFVVEYSKHGWNVDCSDMSMLMVSPPGGGKTKREYIPTIIYNAAVNRNTNGRGASMIITDVKGEEKATCYDLLKDSGYCIYSLDFRHPLYSYHYNLMNNVNKYVDKAKNATDRDSQVIFKAKAEKYAKILAKSIISNTDIPISAASESSQYFNDTSEGLITAIILLVSEYGYDDERHIISVFQLIIDLNGLDDNSTETLQKNRLEQLISLLPPDNRFKLFAGAAIKADVRTSMNIFSSALGKLISFIDEELEQMICDHSSQLNTEEFIKKPTAIFLIIPDEDTTKHFFSSLFIRNMMNELIELAGKETNLELPRKVLCLWDEFGQIPPIKDFDVLLTAARSRGIRFMTALQSLGQLENKYSPAQSKIIRQAFQETLFSYQSPNAVDTAKEFSAALGSYTTQTGSVSRSDYKDSSSVQLVERKLMREDEIINMPPGEWIIMKSGYHPAKLNLKLFFTVFKNVSINNTFGDPQEIKKIHYLTVDKIKRHAQAAYDIKPGQFDAD